jgi:citrate synthase
MTDKKATLTINDGEAPIELGVLSPTLGPDVLDVRALGSKGYFTFDPGFTSTASCESKITFIDGDKGVLLHRGFPIEQLAKESSYLEVCYILLYGETPTAEEFETFKTTVTRHTMIHDQITHLFRGFRRDSHPMAVLCGVTGALAAFYHDALDVNNERHREITAIRLLSKMPTVAAMCYKYSLGQPFVYPRNDLSYAGKLPAHDVQHPVRDQTDQPCAGQGHGSHLDPARRPRTERFDVHRTPAGSSGANPFACIAAGIACTVGACTRRRQRSRTDHARRNQNDVSNIDTFIAKAKDKNDSVQTDGLRSPRVQEPRPTRHRHEKDLRRSAERTGHQERSATRTGDALEEIALTDPYFIERSLYPNVDFYSGIILKAIGIPTSMFTVIFALSRTVGWISHWKEMLSSPYKIGRPRQLYTGYAERDFKSQVKNK